ncbi:unnamed protein product [Closterium sp. NIES-54]
MPPATPALRACRGPALPTRHACPCRLPCLPFELAASSLCARCELALRARRAGPSRSLAFDACLLLLAPLAELLVSLPCLSPCPRLTLRPAGLVVSAFAMVTPRVLRFDAEACIALSSLLPGSEETHFSQVRTASEFVTAIKARYATPSTVSLGRLFLLFLFPDLASFERSTDLIAHLHTMNSRFCAACSDAQLAILPPPMPITIYFIATSLPDRLASDADSELRSLSRSIASASGAVPPPLFHGCTVPQLPTFTTSLATTATDVTAAAVTTSSRSRGRSGRRGGQGAGECGGGGGGDVASGGGGSAEAGGVPRVAAGDSPATAGGGDAWVRQPSTGLPAAGGGTCYSHNRLECGGGDVASGGGGSAEAGGVPRVAAGDSPATAGGGDAWQRQQQVSGQGSGHHQLQRGVVHPPCTYHILTRARRGQPCGRSHPPGQCFSQITGTVRLAYGVDGPASDWFPLVQTYGPTLWGMSASQSVDLLGTPHAMYAVVNSTASDSVYSCVVSLGASLADVHVASVGTCVDTSPGAALVDALLTFTLDYGASHCFFRDRMTLTPLPAPVSVALADPTSGRVTACYTTTLPCPAVPSGSLTGFHVPSFSRNLVGVRPLVGQHVGVWIEPSGETAVCVDLDTYARLATFTAEPGSGLYTLHTGTQEQQQQQQQQQQRLLPSTPVTTPISPVAASCFCWSLAHPTVLWHHRMGHPPIPCLRTMSSQRLVLGLPRVLPSLPPSLAPPCGPCVEGRLRATPYSSSLRPATEPFETLRLDVWGPAPRPGPEQESFFLVVVDNYSRYTTVFPLEKKSEVTCMLIRWLLTIADTRGRHVNSLHSDCGGEFHSSILARFYREQGIRQSWTLPEPPQQNGVAERRIGLVMEIAPP